MADNRTNVSFPSCHLNADGRLGFARERYSAIGFDGPTAHATHLGLMKVLSPPFHHPAPVIEVSRRVVRGPNAAGNVGKLVLDPIGLK
jgi:hypothetical protein